jgi:hypothetical protein
MFANPAAADLHLMASATNAIDKALTLSTVTDDFDGDRRPRGASSDIGADEFTTNAPPKITNLKFTDTQAVMNVTTFLGESYDVLRADAPTGATWTVIANNVPGNGGSIQVTDTNGLGPTSGFYRARISP